jgi:hypothetical protein
MKKQKYWIVVASKEHAMWGVKSGYIQSNHGKEAPLKRIQQDDWVIVYSPKLTMEGDAKCQSFTAIGQASDEEIYQFRMTEDFIPFRRNVKFYECKETSILPLINDLTFIPNKKSWGFPFRFGFFEINETDFKLISSSMLENEK